MEIRERDSSEVRVEINKIYLEKISFIDSVCYRNAISKDSTVTTSTRHYEEAHISPSQVRGSSSRNFEKLFLEG